MLGVPVFAFIVYPLFSRIRLFPLSSSLKFKCEGCLAMGKKYRAGISDISEKGPGTHQQLLTKL